MEPQSAKILILARLYFLDHKDSRYSPEIAISNPSQVGMLGNSSVYVGNDRKYRPTCTQITEVNSSAFIYISVSQGFFLTHQNKIYSCYLKHIYTPPLRMKFILE